MNPFPTKVWQRGAVFLLLLLGCAGTARAQDTLPPDLKYVYFPLPAQRPWTVAVGITATTMPYEITEELHYRIPALELHALRRLGEHWAIDGRASVQVLQNFVSLGPRYSGRLSDRVSFSLGNDVAFWFGKIDREGFKTQATGVQNFPNASLGYRFNRKVLLTLRAESIMTLSINPRAGDIKIKDNFERFSGSAYTVMLEQPFYGRRKWLALGFRAQYTSFFWQTWSAFSTFDRSFFYPQLIACLIL